MSEPGSVVAEKPQRNASRAATLANSRIVAEVRGMRLVVRELLDLTPSIELYPLVRKRLTEVAQLLQTYTRLAELEFAAEEKPRAGMSACGSKRKGGDQGPGGGGDGRGA